MIARLLAVFFALCLTGTAQAQWGAVGTACVPDPATIKFDRMRITNGAVQHAAGNVDLIVLTCPVYPFEQGGTNWSLLLTYRDSTGNTAAQAFVRAQLYSMLFSGTPGAAPTLLATVSSNSSPATGANSVFSAPFSYTFTFTSNVYWVRVELERATTGQTVIFNSIALIHPFFSDIRVKHDIALLGRLDNGLGFYRFSYNGSDAAYVGVMAQEVEAVMPDAVVRGDDGYLRVFYERLGLRMQTWEEWVATGEKIPAPSR
jgi:hypothetical protein